MEKLMSVISYQGTNDVFVYKHPEENFNTNTQLIVQESQQAVFFKDGRALDTFGPGRYTLKTANIPLLRNLISKVAGDDVFQAQVYFFNMTTQMNLRWGTDSRVRMFDPATGLTIDIGACGGFNLRISDPRKLLIKVVGSEKAFGQADVTGQEGTGYSSQTMNGAFKMMLMSKVKSFLPRSIKDNNINIMEVDEHIDDISAYLKEKINVGFEEYGLTMPEFFVTRILTPDDDPNFAKMKQQYADQYLKVHEESIKASEAKARKDRIEVESRTAAMQKTIAAEADAEAITKTGLAEAQVMKAKGYSYQDETTRQVGTALASNESAGNMGAGLANTMMQMGAGISAGIAVGKTATKAVEGAASEAPQPLPNTAPTWECPKCHAQNTGKFCNECGTPKPAPAEAWECPVCHAKNTGKFCHECGAKKPEEK
jgi:membrane protease subunit (stomatin/prohibitin family)